MRLDATTRVQNGMIQSSNEANDVQNVGPRYYQMSGTTVAFLELERHIVLLELLPVFPIEHRMTEIVPGAPRRIDGE